MKKKIPLLIALGLIVFVSGCTSDSSSTTPVNTEGQDLIDQDPVVPPVQDPVPSDTTGSMNCPDKLLDLLNEQSTTLTNNEFKEQVEDYGFFSGYNDFLDVIWKEEAGVSVYGCWYGGKNKGENVNYVYCETRTGCNEIVEDDIFKGYNKVIFLTSHEILSMEETGSEEYGEKYKTTLRLLSCDYEYLEFNDFTECWSGDL